VEAILVGRDLTITDAVPLLMKHADNSRFDIDLPPYFNFFSDGCQRDTLLTLNMRLVEIILIYALSCCQKTRRVLLEFFWLGLVIVA
jgi:hypothetical protein